MERAKHVECYSTQSLLQFFLLIVFVAAVVDAIWFILLYYPFYQWHYRTHSIDIPFHSIPFLGLLLLIRFIACVREYKNQHNIILMHSQVFSDSNDLYVFGMYLVRLMCLDNEKHRKVPVFLLLKCIGMYRLVAHYFREYIKSDNLNNNNNNKRLRAIFYQSIIIIVICTCFSFIYTIENSSKKSINFVLCSRYWMDTCSVIQSFPCKPHQW